MDIRHALTVYNRIAQEEGDAGCVRLALCGRLDRLLEPALEVAAESGEPMGEVLLREANRLDLDDLDRRILAAGGRPGEESIRLTPLLLEANRRRLERRLQGTPQDSAAAASSLGRLFNHLGRRLSAMGRMEEALQAITAGVESDRRAMTLDASRDAERTLARSLHDLGVVQGLCGRHAESVDTLRRSVDLLRAVAGAQPRDELARALDDLAQSLAETGRFEESVDSAREAVALLRTLDEQAATHEHRVPLTRALANLAAALDEVGRGEEAIEMSREAVYRLQCMAEDRFDLHAAERSFGLQNLGIQLSNLGRYEEALDRLRQAEGLLRDLDRETGGRMAADVAFCLSNLGDTLREAGRPGEAIGVLNESSGIYRRLLDDHPHLAADWVRVAHNLAVALSDAGHGEQSLDLVRSAVDDLRRLGPADNLLDLASSLDLLGVLLLEAGDAPGALQAAGEAVELHRRLAEDGGRLGQTRLARTLDNLADTLAVLGRQADAEAARGEARSLVGRRSGAQPADAEP